MTPGPLNLTITRGITFGPVLLKCYADPARSTPTDLTGCTPYAEVRKKADAPVVVNLNPTITDAAAGEVTIALSAAQTAAIPAGGYLWDFILQRPGGERLGPYLAGTFVVAAKITSPA